MQAFNQFGFNMGGGQFITCPIRQVPYYDDIQRAFEIGLDGAKRNFQFIGSRFLMNIRNDNTGGVHNRNFSLKTGSCISNS